VEPFLHVSEVVVVNQKLLKDENSNCWNFDTRFSCQNIPIYTSF